MTTDRKTHTHRGLRYSEGMKISYRDLVHDFNLDSMGTPHATS